jgi:hypothetical protein
LISNYFEVYTCLKMSLFISFVCNNKKSAKVYAEKEIPIPMEYLEAKIDQAYPQTSFASIIKKESRENNPVSYSYNLKR